MLEFGMRLLIIFNGLVYFERMFVLSCVLGKVKQKCREKGLC